MMNRRKFLKATGIVSVIIAGGGVYRAADNGVFSSGQGPAYEPWKNWRDDKIGGPLSLIRAGILAANPHNTQPWLFKVSRDQIQIFADTSRNLGTMDVYLREMHIGLGCAIENMLIAASAKGFKTKLNLLPLDLTTIKSFSKPILCAKIDLEPASPSGSDLYEAIPMRHTDRAIYDKTRKVDAKDLEKIISFSNSDSKVKVIFFTEEKALELFTKGSVQSTKDIINDKTMARDSAKWFRHSWDEVQKYKDGPYIDTAGVSPMMRVLVKIMPPVTEETENKYWLDATINTLTSTPVMGLIAVRELYDRPQSMRAGQIWQRMHLWATTQGLSMQPVNQMLEVIDREKQLNKEQKTSVFLTKLTGDVTWKPTFAFRLGYSAMTALPSPRRPAEETILS